LRAGKQSVKEFEDEYTKATQLYPVNPETAMSPSFSHIFQGGYSADIILTNGQKFWMPMLSSILKKTEFSILKLQQNIKFFFLPEVQKILWNCIRISEEVNRKWKVC
jgi:peptidyl-dipeptidase Dcp